VQGEAPAAIPFQTLDVKKLIVNEAAAQRLELTIPPELVVSAALRRQRRPSAEIRVHLLDVEEERSTMWSRHPECAIPSKVSGALTPRH